MKTLKIISIIILSILGLSILFGTLYFLSVYISASKIDIDESKLKTNFYNLQILDSNDEILSNSNTKYTSVSFDQLNKDTINAFISIEDKRFFTHNGIDFRRIVKATIKNLLSLSFKEGASTISQQLVKNTLLSNEKTINRKIKELKLAKKLEQKYSKKEIIAMYLSAIYFGDGNNGIKNASLYYFNKQPKDLDIIESATLAAIINTPTRLSLKNNKEEVKNRRNIVLKLMNENRYIDNSTYNNLITKDVVAKFNKAVTDSSYIDLVIDEATKKLNVSESELYQNNYIIHTYYQNYNDIIVKIENNDKYLCNIILDNSGKIISISDNNEKIYCRKTNIASLAKPLIVYAPSIEKNIITPATILKDQPTTFGDYSPKNYADMYYGNVTIRKALVESLNIPAVTVYNSLNGKGKEYYEKLGINISDKDGLSASLGAIIDGVSPIDVAKAYSVFANNGVMQDFNAIKSIEDTLGNIIYASESFEKQVFSQDTSYIIYDMLKDVTKNGTAKKLKQYNVASKTGTNGNEKGNFDAWCVSFDKNYTVLSYVGAKKELLDNSITGGTLPAEININVLNRLFGENFGTEIEKPKSVVKIDIDKYYLEKNKVVARAANDTPYKYIISEYFSESKIPKKYSDAFTSPIVDNAKIIDNGKSIQLKIQTQEIYDHLIYNAEDNTYIDIISGSGKTIQREYLIESKDFFQLEIIPTTKNNKIVGKSFFTDKIYIKNNYVP